MRILTSAVMFPEPKALTGMRTLVEELGAKVALTFLPAFKRGSRECNSTQTVTGTGRELPT